MADISTVHACLWTYFQSEYYNSDQANLIKNDEYV